VQTETAISEEFERYDDKEEFRRLVRAVKFSKKHYLYFVCCNQVPKQNDLIAEAKKNLKGKPVKVVKFKKPITDLLTELQKKTIGKNCEAVFVQGLEYSISSDGKGDENALIHNLNISRDSFKKYLSCPLFLWLPEYALVKITRHAPDFFSVRSGTFYFSNPPEKVAEQIFQSVSAHWLEISLLSITEKYKQIEALENLLAEYRGLHKEKQDKYVERRLLSKLAEIFDLISEYGKSIEYTEQALQISREINDRVGESNSLSSLGRAYNNLGEYHKAIEYTEQALQISRENGDQLNESIILSNLGVIYSDLKEYHKAIEHYEQSLKISREISNQLVESKCLGNLGNTYNILGDYSKAIEYIKQSLEISREIGDRISESHNLGNLGNYSDGLGEYRKAIDYYKQSLAISREIGDRTSEGISLFNIGNTYYRLDEKEKACDFWKEAATIFEAIKSPNANLVRQWIEENCGD
jgi:tetratricopeptide (TPR) repeat protein